MSWTRTVAVLFLVPVACLGAAPSEQEARQFFQRYVALGDAYDASVADLYADDARVRAFRRYPHGLERSMEIQGTQWKILLQKVMPLAKAQNDRSEFKEPRFEALDGGMKISAKRYSVRKCYWDPSYFLVLRKQADGRIRIVEEYLETQPQSSC